MPTSMKHAYGSSRPTTTSLLVITLLILSHWVTSTTAIGTAITWGSPPQLSALDNHDRITALLVAPAGPDEAPLAHAKRIIEALSASSTCAHATTARLLKQCKLIKPQHEAADAQSKTENAETAYSISMALCEARQARVSIPSACRVFEDMFDRPLLDDSIETLRTEDLRSCSNQMYHSPSWTSYTAFKAQSRDLCDSSRVDYQREELLYSFRQATNVLPDIIDAIRGHQYDSQLIMTGIRDTAAEVVSAHQETSALLRNHAEESKQQLRSMSSFLMARLKRMEESETSFQVAVKAGIEDASKELSLMQTQAGSVKVNLAEIYAAAAEAVTRMSIDVQASYEQMLDRTDTVAEKMFELAAGGHIQVIQDGLAVGREAATEYASIQSSQVEVSRKQLSLSEEVLNSISHSHGRLEEIQKAIDLIPTSWFDALSVMQDYVTRIRNEMKYALAFVVPATLLLSSVAYEQRLPRS